jgi:hypothetical protein
MYIVSTPKLTYIFYGLYFTCANPNYTCIYTIYSTKLGLGFNILNIPLTHVYTIYNDLYEICVLHNPNPKYMFFYVYYTTLTIRIYSTKLGLMLYI